MEMSTGVFIIYFQRSFVVVDSIFPNRLCSFIFFSVEVGNNIDYFAYVG